MFQLPPNWSINDISKQCQNLCCASTCAHFFFASEFIKLITPFLICLNIQYDTIQYTQCGNERILHYQIYVFFSLPYLQSWYCNECHDPINILMFSPLLTWRIFFILYILEKCMSQNCYFSQWQRTIIFFRNLTQAKNGPWSDISKQLHCLTTSFFLLAVGRICREYEENKKSSQAGANRKKQNETKS